MLTLKLRDIDNPSFNDAIMRLARCNSLSVKTAYNVKRLIDSVAKETRDARVSYLELIKKYAVVDEKGNLKPQMSKERVEDGETIPAQEIPGSWIFKEPATKEEKDKLMDAWKKDNKEFMEVEVTFPKVRKLTIDELEGSGLSAVDLTALELVIDEEDEKPAGATLSVVQ